MQTDSKNINKYIREARRRRIEILPPDINRSERKFTIEGDAIRYGLDSIVKIGAVASRDILAARPYNSLEDFLERGKKGAEKGSIVNLILIGAMDSLGPRVQTLQRLERHRIIADVAPKKRVTLTEEQKDEIWADKRVRLAHKYAIEIPDFTNADVVYEIEKELVGTYVTVDPMARYMDLLDKTAIMEPTDMVAYPKGTPFVVGGQITDITPTVTKKGRNPGSEMGHITITWNEADFRVVVFPKEWASCKFVLKVGAPVACRVEKLDSGCCLKDVERLDILYDQAGIA
jgi:DNA polymerase-3 subunit alpha